MFWNDFVYRCIVKLLQNLLCSASQMRCGCVHLLNLGNMKMSFERSTGQRLCAMPYLEFTGRKNTRKWLLNIWGVWTFKARCATKAWRHNMPPPPASWQYLPSYLFARWHLFRHVGYLRHQQQVDVWPFDLKVVSESRVTWATSVPISVFLGLSVLELGPMYATDRQTDRRQIKASLNASALWRRRYNNA